MIRIRKGFDQISNYLKAVGNGEIRNFAWENELITEAQAIIEQAYKTKDPGNQSFNQHDAFYWALYYNGERISSGYLDPMMAKHESGYMENEDGTLSEVDKYHYYGVEEADKAMTAYTPPSEGYALLIGNAMYYSVIQERGLKYSGDEEDTRYRVLSQTYHKLQNLADRYGGIVYLINMTQ